MIREMQPWLKNDSKQMHLFCDARGTLARLAAVLFAEGRVRFADMPVPEHLMALFEKRGDAQIMGLELLSIALGARVSFTL